MANILEESLPLHQLSATVSNTLFQRTELQSSPLNFMNLDFKAAAFFGVEPCSSLTVTPLFL